MKRLAGGIVLALASCVIADYEPATFVLGRAVDDAGFGACVEVLGLRYVGVQADVRARRAWTDWSVADDDGTPARRRASLWWEDGVLYVVVEVTWLESGAVLGGPPSWSAVRGHARWESELVEAIRARLGA